MKVKYFSDTDTAHVEFTERDVYETKEISENIYIDIDERGNIVSMTNELPRSKLRGINRKLSYRLKRRGLKPLSASGGLVRLRRIEFLELGTLNPADGGSFEL